MRPTWRQVRGETGTIARLAGASRFFGWISLFVPAMVVLPNSGAAPAVDESAEVRGIRFGVHGSRTRVVIDITRRVDFKARLLDRPARLVVDLPEVRWPVEAEALERPRGLATGYRFGLLHPGTSRLVVDLAQPARLRARFALPPGEGVRGWRLVMDLEPRRGAAPPEQPARVAAPPPRVRPPRPRPPELAKPEQIAEKRPVIVLDPGHGGIDPGTIGVGGIREKRLTLTFARVLERELERGGRFRVELTRRDDRFIPLRERIAIARRYGADLFLSIHADSIDDPRVRGASVYTLSERASDQEAERLARKENKADILAGLDLSDQDEVVREILIDLAQRDTNNKSIRLAESLIRALAPVRRLLRQYRRYAGFAVLKSPDTPSVLLELGYLSNREDAARLTDPAYQRRLARAIRKAIEEYFATRRPPL